MPIPILGSLFGTKAAADSSMTSYPDKRDENEWRAVLNKGKFTSCHCFKDTKYFLGTPRHHDAHN